MNKNFKIDGTNTLSLLDLSSGTVRLNLIKYFTDSNTYWYKIKKNKSKYVLLRGHHFLSIYNQVYYSQLVMGISPTFYYPTIHTTIL